MKSIEDFVGLSEYGINDAVQNALENAGNPVDYEVVETLGSLSNNTKRQYQVTLKTIAK